ncbi:hypothetical protein D3C71_1608930 [compost metagenome]
MRVVRRAGQAGLVHHAIKELQVIHDLFLPEGMPQRHQRVVVIGRLIDWHVDMGLYSAIGLRAGGQGHLRQRLGGTLLPVHEGDVARAQGC